MKSHELAAELLALPDMDVILQKDAEGNGYSPLSGLDNNAIYTAESSYSGEVTDTNWSAGDACMNEEEWQEFKDNNPRCIVLFPIN